MKFFGLILLCGYFLARERELFSNKKDMLEGLLRDWAVYVVCAGLALAAGIFGSGLGRTQPVFIFFAATLPGLFFRGRAVWVLLGAFTAFAVLGDVSDLNAAAAKLCIFEAAVFLTAFFYLGARERMSRLFASFPPRGSLAALLIFLGLTVTIGLFYQKAVQLF